MSNIYDAYRDLMESKKSSYQLLLGRVEKAEQHPLEMQVVFIHQCLNLIHILQDEREENGKNFEKLEKMLTIRKTL